VPGKHQETARTLFTLKGLELKTRLRGLTVSKTHYRKVYKSDHLGCADLEDFIEAGQNLVFNIKQVKQETNVSVAGRKGNFNIAYFHEKVKPLVLNATNAKTLKNLAGGSSFIEDWQNIAVQLYIDPSVKMKGDTVGGVRISPQPPRQRQQLTPDMAKPWSNAIAAFQRDGNLIKVLERMDISPENQQLIMQQASQ
jgi:hypothetical protein